MLKKRNTGQEELEMLLGTKIFLELWVKKRRMEKRHPGFENPGV